VADDVNIDLTNYKDRIGQRVPPGRYRVVVDDAEVDKASTGNTMINLWLRIVGQDDYDGAIIIDRLVLTERSLFRVVGFMQAIGMQTPKKRVKVNTRSFIGKTLEVDVDDGDPYNGRVKSEIRGYLRPTGKTSDTTGQPADLPSEFPTDQADDTPADEVDLDKIDLG
jgi:hypothetical protein